MTAELRQQPRTSRRNGFEHIACMITGRRSRSLMRPATMPTTP
jgi:hypothetical protein